MRGPVAKKALYLTRPADTTACVGAQGQVQPRIGALTGARPGRRRRRILIAITARVERRMIIYPIGRRGFPVRKLTCLHLAYNHGPRIDKPLDGHRVDACRWEQSVPGPITIARFHTSDVVDVFDAEADACEGLNCGFGVIKTGGNADSG